ncbi:TadE/TadG family type IV pilus assembly protein [Methylosinus sp. Sm6]|uniref:TadE/TadG family type IV pilus assembly protein n=1 Tax=Methylosinus sp. Sm6 TaxID=2866948 RepID=UPI001C992A3B|nr:TadE/TadG family type IV pilus assembly protein [Methylosinus sp. Sm6]MBY6239866.1 pilus assembly protein [Methylosinus sp. Sm6]
MTRFRIAAAAVRLACDAKGNVAVVFALAAFPLLIAAGGAVDFAIVSRVQTQLYAICDSAALAATTPAMMSQSTSTAKSAAIGMFGAQVAQIKRLAYNSANLTVTVEDATASSTKTRTVTVSYRAQVDNAFGSFYHVPTSSFTVTAASTASTARNIDFYLLLDNSPSMELPATTAGLASMAAATGCVFACHENDLKEAQISASFVGWNSYDSYTYAQNQGIRLRIDNVREAAKRVASSAQTMMAANGATYRIASYAFNFGFTQLHALTSATSANLSAITNGVGTMTPPLMSRENYLPPGASYTYPTSATSWTTATIGSSELNTRDAMTDIGMALKRLNSAVTTNPGSGTTASGDKPQGVVMLVTDGVVDGSFLTTTGCNYYTKAYSNSFNSSFYRCMGPIDTADCKTLKDRGFRIAVLNTVYYPTPGYGFYDSAVAPFTSQVSPALKTCASTDLYFEVDTTGDISDAMLYLFQKVVTSASRLTQ